MAKDGELISSKVAFATGGAASGYTLGKATSILLLYYAIGEVPEHVKLAIEFLCEGGLATIGTFVFGYNKGEPKQ